MTLKALSLTQPWASLVVLGIKKIETRSWRTSYRGVLVIHAAKGFPRWARDLCGDYPWSLALTNHGLSRPEELPVGALLGAVMVQNCLQTTSDLQAVLSDEERQLGDYAPDRFAWQLSHALRFPRPIPCKGALGLWEIPPVELGAVEAVVGFQD